MQPGHFSISALVAIDFTSAIAYSLWLMTTTCAVPLESAMTQSASALPISTRILLDVDEEAEVRLRAGKAGGMQADELDALRHARLDRILQARAVGKERDAVRLQRDRLVHAGQPEVGLPLPSMIVTSQPIFSPASLM